MTHCQSHKKKSPPPVQTGDPHNQYGGDKVPRLYRRGTLTINTAATYSPADACSTIGAAELNCSVRNGKRWNLRAMAA